MRTLRRALPVLLMGVAALAVACTTPTGPAPSTTTTSSTTTTTTTAPPEDADGDGFNELSDCDDTDPSINPGAADPAGDEIDQNCDGIDGTEDTAVFVNANTGADTSECGTILEPCASIGQGQGRAGGLGRTAVYVAGGTYPKFSVQAGLEIRGGYGQNWQRGLTATGNTMATVVGSFDASVNGTVGLIANGITTTTKVADLTVSGSGAAPGSDVVRHRRPGVLQRAHVRLGPRDRRSRGCRVGRFVGFVRHGNAGGRRRERPQRRRQRGLHR